MLLLEKYYQNCQAFFGRSKCKWVKIYERSIMDKEIIDEIPWILFQGPKQIVPLDRNPVVLLCRSLNLVEKDFATCVRAVRFVCCMMYVLLQVSHRFVCVLFICLFVFVHVVFHVCVTLTTPLPQELPIGKTMF